MLVDLMVPTTSLRHGSFLLAVALFGCGDDTATGSTGDAGGSGGTTSSAGGADCNEDGKPEMTGPITGLKASYQAGEAFEIGVPVDADTKRVIVGVYEVGSVLYVAGTAKEATSGTTNLSLFAGVKDGEIGTFYISVELCSTSVCATPFVRNTYNRADTSADLAPSEKYVQTRENVGTPANRKTCPTDIEIQTFEIQ
jgi:hypothetical protein